MILAVTALAIAGCATGPKISTKTDEGADFGT
jgi:hypothetical protein